MLAIALASLTCLAPAPDEADPPAPKVELEFGARVFIRPEARANPSLGAVANDDQWRVLQSARIDGGARYGPLRAVVQLQDVRPWGDRSTTLSVEPSTGAHQAFGELSSDPSDATRRAWGLLRVGRQEVLLWQGRLIGVSPWQPSRRAFDAVRGRIESERFAFEAGGAILRAPRTLTLTDEVSTTTVDSDGDQLAWSEASAAIHPAFEAHAGYILLRQDATEGAPTRERTLHTPGLYLHGIPTKGLSYAVEAYGQFGRDADRRHVAWSGSAAVQYVFSVKANPGLRLEYALSTGSACENDPAVSSTCGEATPRDFDQHFGNRHGIRGFADLFALTNNRDLHGRAFLRPDPKIQLLLDYHWLQLHEPKGRWINTAGAPVGRGWDPDNTEHTLGHEVDLQASYSPWAPLSVRPGYSVFIPTAAGRTLAGEQPLHFVYLWLLLEIGGRWQPGG